MTKANSKKLLKLLVIVILVLTYLLLSKDLKESFSTSKTMSSETKETLNETTNFLKVSFIDVGQADAILLKEQDQYVLIDAGNNNDGPKLVDYFKRQGIESFKHVFATHPHEDHIGGMDDIINNFTIENFYMPDAIATTKTFEDMLTALEQKNITVTIPNKNDQIELLNAKMKILYVGSSEKDLNDTSIIIKTIYNKISFLFMGDASKKAEKQLDIKNLKSDVLKIGHHGSKTSTSKDFLTTVNPNYAVISVGKDNKYHHPATTTLNLLKNQNITVYRTDEDGTTTMITDGINIEIKTQQTNTNG